MLFMQDGRVGDRLCEGDRGGFGVIDRIPSWRAAASPTPLRLDASAGEDAERAPPMRVLWFARQHPRGVSLYQATAIGQPSAPDALETFFEGLRLP
jgi:hypothetical protein